MQWHGVTIVRHKTKVKKDYFAKLKNDVKSEIAKNKARFHKFNWNTINRATHQKIRQTKPIVIGSSKYTLKELGKEMNVRKKSIETRLKATYYNKILRAYSKSTADVADDKRIPVIYNRYKKQVLLESKFITQDIEFCLQAMKAITSYLKSNR